jgi:two-component system, oxyanion-binding sensor
LAEILSAPYYLDLPASVIAPSLLGNFSTRPGAVESVPDFHVFSRGDANAPTTARATHLQHELVAAGIVPRSALQTGLPARLFREDLFRQAIANPNYDHEPIHV